MQFDVGEQDDELTESLTKFWETESVGIIPEDQLLSADKQKPEVYYNGHNLRDRITMEGRFSTVYE